MPSMICRCGEKLGYGEIPNPIEWLTISDVEYDAFCGQIDAEDLYMKMRSILKCVKCGRLWVFWDGFDRPPSVYSPD